MDRRSESVNMKYHMRTGVIPVDYLLTKLVDKAMWVSVWEQAIQSFASWMPPPHAQVRAPYLILRSLQ